MLIMVLLESSALAVIREPSNSVAVLDCGCFIPWPYFQFHCRQHGDSHKEGASLAQYKAMPGKDRYLDLPILPNHDS